MKIAFICRDGTYRSQVFKEVAKELGLEAEAYGLSEIADFYGLFPYWKKLEKFQPDFILLLFNYDEVSAYYEFGERREIIKVLKHRGVKNSYIEINNKKVPVRKVFIPEFLPEEKIRKIAKEIINIVLKEKDKVKSEDLERLASDYITEKDI